MAGTLDRTSNPERVSSGDHRRGALATLVVVAAWVALAVWRPTTTFHLAPLLAAGAWPFLLRRGPLRVAVVDAARAAVASGVITIVAGVVLAALDLLRGPTFWDSGAALLEVPLASMIGAYSGYRYARCGIAAV